MTLTPKPPATREQLQRERDSLRLLLTKLDIGLRLLVHQDLGAEVRAELSALRQQIETELGPLQYQGSDRTRIGGRHHEPTAGRRAP